MFDIGRVTDRTFQVRIGKDLSGIRPIALGIPQGSTFSPLLFPLFSTDIHSLPKALLDLYADGIKLNRSHKVILHVAGSLQEHLLTFEMKREMEILDQWGEV